MVNFSSMIQDEVTSPSKELRIPIKLEVSAEKRPANLRDLSSQAIHVKNVKNMKAIKKATDVIIPKKKKNIKSQKSEHMETW